MNYRGNGSAPLEPSHIPPQDVHDHRFRNVVRVVTRHDLVHAEHHGAPVQGLSTEDSAEGAIVFATDLSFDESVFQF